MRTEEVQKPTMNISDIIGEFRFTQKYVYATLVCMTTVICWHSFTVTFIAPSVKHYCYDYEDITAYNETMFEETNKQVERNASLIVSEHFKMTSVDACTCTKWRYDHDVFKSTLTEKLDLVCNRAWLASFGSSLYMLGGLIGSMLFGQVADSFGRRRTMLVLILPVIASNVLILFTANYAMFAVGQFICGACGTGLFNICFVLLMETVGTEYRSVLGTSIEFSFSTGQLLLLVTAYFLRDWFHIQLVAVVLTSSLIIMIWFLPESPSWLLVSGRDDSARKTIVKIVRRNRLPLEGLELKIEELRKQIAISVKDKDSDRKYSVLDLFWTPRLRRWSLIILAYCFMAGFIFCGISLNIGIFGNDLFLDFFLSTVITYPGGAVCLLIVKYFSRKKSLAGVALGSGIVCLAYIPAVMGPDWIQITVVTLARCLITPAFPMSNTYLAELFPTPIRSIGMGAGGLTAKVGAAIAPFLKELGAISDSRVPMAVLGGVAILCGVFVAFLPETKDLKLPDTIEEREQSEVNSVARQSTGSMHHCTSAP